MYDEADINSEAVILCAANAYEQKYYLNENFSSLPQTIKDELQIMCVLYTAEIGGIFSLQYDEEGSLYMNVVAEEDDFDITRRFRCYTDAGIINYIWLCVITYIEM